MKRSSFVEGTIVATLAIVFSKILGMLYVIPFYALVGIKGSALYAYAYNIYIIFLDISSAGLPVAMSKIINEYNTLGMLDAKARAFKIGKKIMVMLGVAVFLILMIFAPQIAHILLGNLSGGNTIADVSFAIRCVSFAILVIPFLSVTRGYLQGHHILNITGLNQVIEQLVRVSVVLGGSYFVLKVLNGSVTSAVGVAVFATFISALVAYLALKFVIKKSNDKIFDFDKNIKKDDVSNREIVKKIFSYAIPFIIINIVGSCYNFIDMTLILRVMNHLNYSALDVEFITSAVTTWGPKINMVITSVAMGMSASLIPTMVHAYTLKNWDEVNRKFNQALQIILYVSLPMAVGISMLSGSIWSVFYGYNRNGQIILSLCVFMALFLNIYMTTSSSLQGLNKFKVVYLSTICGFATNALLDVPMMLLFNKIGIPSYLGATTASIIGYGLSILIALIALKKDCNLKYRETIKLTGKMLISLVFMILAVYLMMNLISVNLYSKMSCVLYIGINALVGAVVYLLVSYKLGIISKVFGKENVNKIIKKLTFGKISI